MLLLGRDAVRGAGGVLVSGPFGVALVRRELASAAADAVWGRRPIGAFLIDASTRRQSVMMLDYSGPVVYLTVLGSMSVGARAVGDPIVQELPVPLWGYPFDPVQWQVLEGSFADAEVGDWTPTCADSVEAGAVRIGRDPDEEERPVAPRIGAGAVDASVAPAKGASPAWADEPRDPVGPPPPPPSAEPPRSDSVRDLPVSAPPVDARTPSDAESQNDSLSGPSEGGFSAAVAPPSPSGGLLWAPDPVPPAPETMLSNPTPEPPELEPLPAPPAPFALEPLPAPPAIRPLPDAPVPEPPPTPFEDDDPPPLDAAPIGAPACEGGVRAPAAAPALEALEKTLSPRMFQSMNSLSEVEKTIVRRNPSSAEAQPVGYLIHGGSAPVELSRDVIIGREPDPRALTGRPAASTLRLISPAHEISRSHCAVMATGPGEWSIMDLGSVNGTLVRRIDGTREEATPMVAVPLSDGDLIDVGESTTIEFRIR